MFYLALNLIRNQVGEEAEPTTDQKVTSVRDEGSSVEWPPLGYCHIVPKFIHFYFINYLLQFIIFI